MTTTLQVPSQAAVGRLDLFMANRLSLSRSAVTSLIKSGAVQVNSKPVKPSYPLQPGDIITIDEIEPETKPVREPPDLEVVYKDPDIIVINKPAGLLTHAASTASGPSVADFARAYTTDPDPDRPGIVHRLDKDTSGLMVIARTTEAKIYLQQLFKDHGVQKTYTLLSIGRLKPSAAVIRMPIGRDEAHPLRRAISAHGKEAVTTYTTIATYTGYSLVEAMPATGRTHQIRVHFASLGHPIAGDTLYGNPKRPLGLRRQFLHASNLKFTAPSGKFLDLSAPLPEDLESVLHNQLSSD